MIRKLFFALLAVVTLAACSSDPEYHGMTTEQKEAYGSAIAGEYEGTYIIIYNGNGGDDEVVKVEKSQVTITGQAMHTVLFHNYPVSMLSKVVSDPALAEALASAPDVDFRADYRFYDLQDNGDVNWGFELTNIPLTLHYGGADHHLLLKLRSGVYFNLTKANIDAGKPFADQRVFQFEVEGIYEGDTPVQEFDDFWTNNNMFLTYFQLGK